MTMTLMVENMPADFSTYSSGKSELTPTGSYYKFYQSKLRQLLTQTRYREEQEARIARQKPSKYSPNENRFVEQRLHREYMNHIRERSKAKAQEMLANKIEESKKRPDSGTSNSNRTVTLSVISTTVESRPKCIIKPKQTPILPKQQRITSAPISCDKILNKPKIIKINCTSKNLPKSNIPSYTQVASSSQNLNNKTSERARKAILETIMFHLNTHIPSNTSLWQIYEDIHNKFSSSIAPTVYTDFERIV